MTVNLSPEGRVSIPAPIRRELGLEPGTALVTYVEDGRVVLETREHLVHRIQTTAAGLGTGTSVVDDLLADRRREAAVDKRRLDA